MKKRPTIKDVARECGVAISSVSKALNLPADQCPLLPANRDRIIRTAAALGYSPNRRAQALVKRRTMNVVAVFPKGPPLAHTVYSDMFSAMADTLAERGFTLSFLPMGRGSGGSLLSLYDQRADGVAVFGSGNSDMIAAALDMKVPIVLVNDRSEEKGVDCVTVDDAGGMATLTRHLVELGHRRIVMYQGAASAFPHYSHRERARAFQESMASLGLAEGAEEVAGIPGATLADRLAAPDNDVTAVIGHSHFRGIEMLKHLRERGVAVPERISIAAFNDVYPVEHVHPPMTVIALPSEDMGRAAAERLLAKIEGREDGRARVQVLPERLIVRTSTMPPPDTLS